MSANFSISTLALQEHRQPIQLRIVLIRPVLESLEELCSFIGRNFPFVREVALMAAEPIGFARANPDLCQVDLCEWHDTLTAAVRALQRFQVPPVLMNTPLCVLPRALWRYASRSISDWKNVAAAECAACEVRAECPGLFAWHDQGWPPGRIRAVTREDA